MFDVCRQQLSNCEHTTDWAYFASFFLFKNFLFRCLVNGGRAVLEEYLTEQESLLYCMMELFDLQVSRVGRFLWN